MPSVCDLRSDGGNTKENICQRKQDDGGTRTKELSRANCTDNLEEIVIYGLVKR